jgi:uncharacterized protein
MAIENHKIDRRHFLGLSAAALLATPYRATANETAIGNTGIARPHYVASCRQGVDQFSAIAFDPGGFVAQRVELPARGHDIAMRPGSTECVVFARRPGTFAIAFDAAGLKAAQNFVTRPDRHFFGHGVFSPDGRLLYSTENDFAGERGMISVRDATGGYSQIGEFPSGGIGPHDIALLSDGVTLVVANGGIDTNPDSGRAPLNIDTMQPSLAYIDVRTGEIIEQQMLPPELHQLSIRHLAVAANDVVTFGCQHEGEGQPALVGWHQRGALPALFEAPGETYSAMKNYVGSVSDYCFGNVPPRRACVVF